MNNASNFSHIWRADPSHCWPSTTLLSHATSPRRIAVLETHLFTQCVDQSHSCHRVMINHTEIIPTAYLLRSSTKLFIDAKNFFCILAQNDRVFANLFWHFSFINLLLQMKTVGCYRGHYKTLFCSFVEAADPYHEPLNLHSHKLSFGKKPKTWKLDALIGWLQQDKTNIQMLFY